FDQPPKQRHGYLSSIVVRGSKDIVPWIVRAPIDPLVRGVNRGIDPEACDPAIYLFLDGFNPQRASESGKYQGNQA
ncbi:MAG TPA: hypothetical protein VLD15_04485, partial [Burkholderiales bacterium]|nr:hypothetical protein [Burkholderiales bacterium]